MRFRKRQATTRAVILSWTSYVFLLAGVGALVYAAYVLVDAETFQAMELRKLEHAAPLAEPYLPVVGEVIGRMAIPRLSLKAIVAQGDSSEVLRRSVGHLPETPLPGEPGNVALAAHRDRLFRKLSGIRYGDIILVDTPTGSFRYQVESTRVVAPGDLSVLRSSNQRELTLITCFPFDFVGPAPERFIVRARELPFSGQ
jgi:sortase A